MIAHGEVDTDLTPPTPSYTVPGSEVVWNCVRFTPTAAACNLIRLPRLLEVV